MCCSISRSGAHHEPVAAQPVPEELLQKLQGDRRMRCGVQLPPRLPISVNQRAQRISVDSAFTA